MKPHCLLCVVVLHISNASTSKMRATASLWEHVVKAWCCPQKRSAQQQFTKAATQFLQRSFHIQIRYTRSPFFPAAWHLVSHGLFPKNAIPTHANSLKISFAKQWVDALRKRLCLVISIREPQTTSSRQHQLLVAWCANGACPTKWAPWRGMVSNKCSWAKTS